MHVVFPTTPAQYFHLLRRQLRRNFRKPLIVAGPKALLRLPVSRRAQYHSTLPLTFILLQAAASSLDDMASGTKFSPVLDDPFVTDKSKVTRVIFCTGKVYYDLVKERQTRNDSASARVAFVRLEELCPFPFSEIREVLSGYHGAQEFIWLQEEPRNQGAYGHVAPRLQAVLPKSGQGELLRYVGRMEAAVPAPGVAKLYAAQQKTLINSAFSGL